MKIAVAVALAHTATPSAHATNAAFQLAASPLTYPADESIYRRAVAVSERGIGLESVSHFDAQNVEYTHATTFSRFNPQGTLLGGNYAVGPQPYDTNVVASAFAGEVPVGSAPYQKSAYWYPVTVAARWDPMTGQMSSLPMPTKPPLTEPAFSARAQFANRNGFVAGWAFDSGGDGYFARWNLKTNAVEPLSLLSNTHLSEEGGARLSGIGSNGIVVGNDWLTRTDGNLRSQDERALVWPVGVTAPVVLPVPAYAVDESFHAAADAVNASGVAVGRITHEERFDYPGGRTIRQTTTRVRWDPGAAAATALTLPLTAQGEYGSAFEPASMRINDAGTIVDVSEEKYDPNVDASTPYAGTRTIRWDPGQTVGTVLGNLGSNVHGYGNAQPRDINSSSTILGVSYAYDASHTFAGQRGVIWLNGQSRPIDLSSYLPAGYRVTNVLDITDTGWVAGESTYYQADGTPLNPVPMILLVPQAGTYGRGDGNFDTLVNFADLLLLARHYGQPSNGSVDVADFDLNGTTDFSDLLKLARNYQGAASGDLASLTSQSFATDWALAQSLTPEPTLAAALPCSVAFKRRRRRSARVA